MLPDADDNKEDALQRNPRETTSETVRRMVDCTPRESAEMVRKLNGKMEELQKQVDENKTEAKQGRHTSDNETASHIGSLTKGLSTVEGAVSVLFAERKEDHKEVMAAIDDVKDDTRVLSTTTSALGIAMGGVEERVAEHSTKITAMQTQENKATADKLASYHGVIKAFMIAAASAAGGFTAAHFFGAI